MRLNQLVPAAQGVAGNTDGRVTFGNPGEPGPGRLWFTMALSPGSAGEWVQRMLSLQPAGVLTFVVRRLDGTPIGSSSYLNVAAGNRRLETGATWYSASARRTGVNTECTLLMLGHAFDTRGCIAVEFRTHLFNTTSRAAIEWLGAKLDGVLCSYQLLADGSRRDTVVCSVLDIEWPAVRNNLRFRPGQAVSRPD